MPAKTTDIVKEVAELQKKVSEVFLPPELKERALGMVDRLGRMTLHGEYSAEYERTTQYIDWVTHLPWNKRRGPFYRIRL